MTPRRALLLAAFAAAATTASADDARTPNSARYFFGVEGPTRPLALFVAEELIAFDPNTGTTLKVQPRSLTTTVGGGIKGSVDLLVVVGETPISAVKNIPIEGQFRIREDVAEEYFDSAAPGFNFGMVRRERVGYEFTFNGLKEPAALLVTGRMNFTRESRGLDGEYTNSFISGIDTFTAEFKGRCENFRGESRPTLDNVTTLRGRFLESAATFKNTDGFFRDWEGDGVVQQFTNLAGTTSTFSQAGASRIRTDWWGGDGSRPGFLNVRNLNERAEFKGSFQAYLGTTRDEAVTALEMSAFNGVDTPLKFWPTAADWNAKGAVLTTYRATYQPELVTEWLLLGTAMDGE
ncbi:MAG: hypothetical protein SF028_01950 [Candidatus Sumerlaeia bacterium]|nr:hypothetical protein [Candidatus Sumerlaeia bacterium]